MTNKDSFVVGDTVVCVDKALSAPGLTLNKSYTVTGLFRDYPSLIRVKDDLGVERNWLASRFVAATPSPPSDEELAAEFRTISIRKTEISKELEARGYALYSKWKTDRVFMKSIMQDKTPEYKFTKVTTTTVEI